MGRGWKWVKGNLKIPRQSFTRQEFHKAWKSGAGAERQRMQSVNNIKRMLSILSLVAVRLLQLREALTHKGEGSKVPVREVLREEEIVMLLDYAKNNFNSGIRKNQVKLEWAYQIIAKLGGWSNSKRTGIASWQIIWDGWFRLQERLEGYYVAKKNIQRYDQELGLAAWAII